MEQLLQKIVAKRLGINKQLESALSYDNDIARLNKQKIDEACAKEMYNVRQHGISRAEFEYHGSPEVLRCIVREETDPNAQALQVIYARYKPPQVAMTLEYMRHARGNIVYCEQTRRQAEIYQQELKLAKVFYLKAQEESERLEWIRDRDYTYRTRLSAAYLAFYAKKEQQEQIYMLSMKYKQQQLENLEKTRSYSIRLRRYTNEDRLQGNLQNVQQRFDTKVEYISKLRDVEEQAYYNYQYHRYELIEAMQHRAICTKEVIYRHNNEKENRFYSNYYRRVGMFKRREEAYAQASLRYFQTQGEFTRERSELRKAKWGSVKAAHDQMTASSFENKGNKWSAEMEAHERARQRAFEDRVYQIEKLRHYDDFKANLAKSKQQQLDEKMKYEAEIHNMVLQQRYRKVDEFLEYKAKAQNFNQQYSIDDLRRAALEYSSMDYQRGDYIVSSVGRISAVKNAESKGKIVLIDYQELEQMIAEFEHREVEVKKYMQKASTEEKIRLLGDLSHERDRITEIQRYINRYLLSRMKTGQV